MKIIHFFDAVTIIIIAGFLMTINAIKKQNIWTLEEISFQSSLRNSEPPNYSFHRTVVSNEKRCLSFGFETNESSIVRLLISAQESNE